MGQSKSSAKIRSVHVATCAGFTSTLNCVPGAMPPASYPLIFQRWTLSS